MPISRRDAKKAKKPVIAEEADGELPICSSGKGATVSAGDEDSHVLNAC